MRLLVVWRRTRCFLLRRSTVLLEQLLGRVVLGGFFQLLNGDVALLVEPLEVRVGLGDAVVEEACERIADKVDAATGQL